MALYSFMCRRSLTLCVSNDTARQPIYHKQSGSVSSPQMDDEDDENGDFERIALVQPRTSSVGKCFFLPHSGHLLLTDRFSSTNDVC